MLLLVTGKGQTLTVPDERDPAFSSSLTQGSLLHPAELTGMWSSPEESLRTSATNSGDQKNLPVPLHAQSTSSTSENPSSSSPPSSRMHPASLSSLQVPSAWHSTQIPHMQQQHPLQPCTGLCDSPQPTCCGLNPGSWQQQPAELASGTDTEVLQSLY